MKIGSVINRYIDRDEATPEIDISFGEGEFELMNMNLRLTDYTVGHAVPGVLAYFTTESDGTNVLLPLLDGHFSVRNDLVWTGPITVRGPGKWHGAAELGVVAPIRFNVAYRRISR